MTGSARGWLRGFLPAGAPVANREVGVGAAGAALGLFLVFVASRWALGQTDPWFVAPMGASAVLLFAVPSSPLAQPWSLVGGNVVSAAIGVAFARWLPDAALAASLAPACAIAAMLALRCLHPPSGAVAATAVLGGPAITHLGFRFVLSPVLADSLMLVAAAIVFNTLAGRRYPHGPLPRPHPHDTRDESPGRRVGPTPEDVLAALREQRDLLDISVDDLEQVLGRAERRAWERRFGDVRCRDVMSRDVVTVQPETPTHLAWNLLLQHRVKALPVVDTTRGGRLEGIVTMHDFFVGFAQARDVGRGADSAVRHMMTAPVETASAEQHIVDLITTFSDGGRHHLPVVDDRGLLLGMVTQSDMIAALFRLGLERQTAEPPVGASPAEGVPGTPEPSPLWSRGF